LADFSGKLSALRAIQKDRGLVTALFGGNKFVPPAGATIIIFCLVLLFVIKIPSKIG
jgi:hypothetical protein